ncbi:MAG: ECF transporter S component [Oscillospiraceae bacterium]|nr:ECF transporter S component [Oscillospiraceae bacterium]
MNQTKKLILAAMFLAIGLVLPLFIGQIPEIGMMLLPMHLPVLLCGLILGMKHGLAVGLVLPVMRSLIFGMPVMIPMAVAMSFELATYGLVIGLLYHSSKWKCLLALFRSMLVAMVAGRVVWGVAMVVILGATGSAFSWQAFIGGALLNAIPGILLQLVLIPMIMIALNKTGLVPFNTGHRRKASSEE